MFLYNFIAFIHSIIRHSLPLVFPPLVGKTIRGLHHVHLIGELTLRLALEYLIMEINRVVILIR